MSGMQQTTSPTGQMVFAAAVAAGSVVLLATQANGVTNFPAWKEGLRGREAQNLLDAAVPELRTYAMRMLQLDTRPIGMADTPAQRKTRLDAIDSDPAYQPVDVDAQPDLAIRTVTNSKRTEQRERARERYLEGQQDRADKQDAAFRTASPAVFDWLELHCSSGILAEVRADPRYKVAREDGEYGRDGHALYALLKELYGAPPSYDTYDMMQARSAMRKRMDEVVQAEARHQVEHGG
jgi:hypothetical protein